MDPSAAPIGHEIALHHGPPPIGMGQDVRGGKDGDMFAGRVRAHAKEERVARFSFRIWNFFEPVPCRVPQRLFPVLFGPIWGIRRRGHRLGPIEVPINSANETETITSRAAFARLVLIGRVEPASRLCEDAALNIAHL